MAEPIDATPTPCEARDADGVWHAAQALGPRHGPGRCDLCRGDYPPVRHDFHVQWVQFDSSDEWNPIPWPSDAVRFPEPVG